MGVHFRLLFWAMIWLNRYGTCVAFLNITSGAPSSHFDIIVGEKKELTFDYVITHNNTSDQTNSSILVSLTDYYILDLISPKKHVMSPGSLTGRLKVRIEGLLPGRANLQIQYSRENTNSTVYHLHVRRIETFADKALDIVVLSIVAVTNIGLGCEVHLDVVCAQLKTPKALAIYLCSQYLYMPLIGYVVVELSNLMPGVQLGLFALSCSPGGTASIAYAYLLRGSVSLSVTMIILSTIAALGFFPLWLFTLGSNMTRDYEIRIPYHIIMGSLIGTMIPCFMGIYIRRKHPHLSTLLISSIKYLILLFVVVIGTLGVWLNFYVFQLMRPRVLLASALIPYLGYLLGGLTAHFMGEDRGSVVTIALGTGIQNNGVPIVLMRLSLTGPERDTSIVGPIASAFLSTQPLLIATLILRLRQKQSCKKTSAMVVPEDARLPNDIEDCNTKSSFHTRELEEINQSQHSIKKDESNLCCEELNLSSTAISDSRTVI